MAPCSFPGLHPCCQHVRPLRVLSRATTTSSEQTLTCDAAMPPNRTSRPGTIPENLIVNWRPSNARVGPRTLLRRPVTACDACRAAKAKCSGKQGCDRCTTRRLVCTYKSQVTASRCPPSGDAIQTASTKAMSPTQATNQEAPAVVSAGYISAEDHPGDSLESVTLAGGTNVLQHQSIYPVNLGLQSTALEDQEFRPTDHSDPLDNDAPQCLDTIPQTSLQGGCNQGCGDKAQRMSSNASESSASSRLQNHQRMLPSCMCRPDLMLCLPKVTSAMQEKHLDEIFKVTGEFIKRCQDVMDCKNSQANCTDLLLVVTSLQEIHPCFDYIAKSDLDSAVKVSFGSYEVSSNDANLRAMLVMDLVRRTDTLLTSVSSRGQSMINELSEPSCLASANVAYLEAMISHFRTILRCVTVYMEEAVHNGGSVSETLLNESASAAS